LSKLKIGLDRVKRADIIVNQLNKKCGSRARASLRVRTACPPAGGRPRF